MYVLFVTTGLLQPRPPDTIRRIQYPTGFAADRQGIAGSTHTGNRHFVTTQAAHWAGGRGGRQGLPWCRQFCREIGQVAAGEVRKAAVAPVVGAVVHK